MNFVKSSLKYPQVTVTVLLLTFIVGVNSLLHMPRREDAKINIRQGQIIAFYPGANSAQVEEQVTRKLEQYLFQHEEVRREKTFSTTRDGVVIINVWLNDEVKNSDVFWAKLRHQLLVLKAVDLPQGVRELFVNSDFSDTETLVIGIEADRHDYVRLKNCAQKIEDGLRTIKAISKIKRIGEQKEQIVIALDSAKLHLHGIAPVTIIRILQSQNTIGASGDVKTTDSKIPLYAKGYFKTEREIADQIIGTSKTGETIRLKDIATIKRQYREPESKILVNGRSAVMLAVQMHEGYNVVENGKIIDEKLAELSKLLPADITVTTIANQPKIVQGNVSRFIHEFFAAIVAVILVIVLLLPLRVAVVAAMAIPVTISITFTLMHVFGIELHQVSLAALIVALGMVVDDAVVIADNYVALLDGGMERRTAAWRCATDLVVPILTATVTIIAAFLPMLVLTGAIREFIIALPLTVSIALASSFIVAMILTPLLCFLFIKGGVHTTGAGEKLTFLDIMQAGYDRAISWCMVHRTVTILGCFVAVPLALLVLQVVPHKFFPAAERNQCLIELWMPTGTKLAKTEQSILKIQNLIASDKRISSYATFIGTSAPRFYYNFTPEAPARNFAQILINTYDKEGAERLHDDLDIRLSQEFQEGMVHVKLMQQGIHESAPIEVRIVGDDIGTLKRIGEQVRDILRKTNESRMIHSDFREDYYGVDIRLKDDAERLGFTTSSIADSVYAGFTGVPISTMYEGDDAIEILLRLDDSRRANFQELRDMYLTSPVTGSGVPLRQIAELEPKWHNGRIIHRNGLRTMTIQCDPIPGVMTSQLQKKIMPEISRLSLPVGYRIEYGGEYENRNETFSKLFLAMKISLIAIFIILLFQFRTVKESLIVMVTIPLSMFGALLGLLITGNPFGFTAFVGLVSLMGIIVRNAIILIDYTDDLVRNGENIATAALDAGKRRMRPVFLTASAAAAGVVPMIVSGSPLWSPLASVIAVGVMLSMVISLLLVPVLYSCLMKPGDRNMSIGKNKVKAGLIVLLYLCGPVFFSPDGHAQEPPLNLNLQTVIDMAVENNRLLGIKRMQIDERKQKVNEERVKYFPAVIAGSSYQYNSDRAYETVPKGSFGQLPLGGTTIELPATDKQFALSDHDQYVAGAAFYQPILQIPKIKTGVDIAKTDVEITNIEYSKAVAQTKQAAERLYFGLLILQKQKEEANIRLSSAQLKLHDIDSALLAGKTTASSKIGLSADVADEEQNLLKVKIQINNYEADLKHLTGLPPSSSIVLDPVSVDNLQYERLPVEHYIRDAQTGNNDLKLAELHKIKSEQAITAGKYGDLPEFGIIGGHTYQEGNDIYPQNNTFIGLSFKWNFQDLASNSYVKKQRMYLKRQAEEHMINTREQVSVDIEKAYRKLMEASELIALSKKVVDFRREDFKIQRDRHDAGLNLESDFLTAKAALIKSESDLLAAQLNYRMAVTDLQMLTFSDIF